MGRGQELLDAAREGHSRTVEKLLAQINKRSGPFTSDVRYSFQRSWIKTKKFSNKMFGTDSLRRGAGPNVQDDNGYTPLHHACLNGHRDIIRTLLEMGASPCTVDKKGATPLHLAAFKGDAEAVGMLLEHNNPPVNVDQLTHDGDSALLIAAQFGFTSVVSQLIVRGADITIKNINGDSALDLAAHYGKFSVVRHLLQVRPQLADQYINRNIEYSSTPLHRASMNGRKEVVIALLEAGMDPNVRTANGTPLHEAARYGKASVVRVLLNKGADLRAMDSKKKTVYDLLAEYPEEALRKVRKVIREYVTNEATYDSDNEDLPPFPVPEYSPTPILNIVKPKPPAHRPLCTKASSTSINDDKQKDNVTNARFPTKFPPSPRSPSKSPVSDTSTEGFRQRSDTFQNKTNNNKQLKILGDSIKSNASSAVLYDHQNQLITELAKKINTAGTEEVLPTESTLDTTETLYENLKKNIASDKNNERQRCNTLDRLEITSSDAFDSGSMKKKPKPLPKPMGSPDELNVDYGDDNVDAIYVNSCFNKEEGIYENYTKNVSDDEKVKSGHADEPDRPPSYFDMDGLKRLHHQRSMLNICGHSCDNIETYDEVYYIRMGGKTLRERRLSNPGYLSMNRLKSDSVHIRGDIGCIYASPDYIDIYEINPKTLRGNAHPFIKKKVKACPMPCYCHEDPNREDKLLRKTKQKPSSGSQPTFYSCEDIYVSMNREDVNTSLKNSKPENAAFKHTFIHTEQSQDEDKDNLQVSQENLRLRERTETLELKSRGLVKKKLTQVKQLIADWKTSETQKNTNKHDSLISPPSSSINKHHPQSFVKKLASKCLGLKAKFNSAPNISNSSAAEVDVKSKQPDNKNSTNTLLIGNSKFFKMLSKKEESGEIVCNDEFDTISLDRLGTLNRDSVVNRSNRSCPGFKTSLPNISENNELSDSQESISESVVITEIDCNKINDNINEAVNYNTNFNIFEPREGANRKSVISTASTESRHLVNECYESYEVFKSQSESVTKMSVPIPQPRPTAVVGKNINDGTIYENIIVEVKNVPKPAARVHIPVKALDDVQKQTLYENIALLQEKKHPEPHKRKLVKVNSNSSSITENTSSIDSRSSTMSSDSMLDETNLEDILLSEKSKSFRHRKITSGPNTKLQISRTQSLASDASDVTEASALENVDCSGDTDEKSIYLSMTGTLPNKKTVDTTKRKVLFRHKTFTNIEVDRNSIKVKDLPEWNNEFLKETLAHYHIRGTGHCIYKAPTVQEFIYIFNRDTLYTDVPPFTKIPNNRRDSEFETAICFCRPRPPKFHSSAEDLIDKTNQVEDGRVIIDIDAINKKRELLSSSFKCYCASDSCTLHSTRRDTPIDLVVKFSAIKKSISTPDISLDLSPYSTASKTNLPKNKSVPSHLEEPYAVVNVQDIIARNTKQCESTKTPDSPVYTLMSQTSTVSSTTSARPYSVKDIAEVISLSDHSTSTTTSISCASGVPLPIRKSSSSEYSGHWSLHTCSSNVTIQSDASFKTCLEESSDDSDGTLHSDAENSDSESSDAETVKSDVSTSKRPWVHSDSFRFGSNSKPGIDVILEETQSSPDDKSESSKYESGICLEGSVSSLSECEDDSGIPRVDADADVSLGCASLERVSGLVGGVRSGSGRRRWDEAEGTSEGDALSISSAASSCAPLHLAHHHPYSKVSPTPPKKPPRRNLSVSPTHANSPSSGYSYELRPHARSQDDLDDIQGAKHYLKHGRSVDQYVDGKLSYSEYEENHNSPRVAPIPNPRPSLKQRSQPVAITAMYENVVIKEQNPRRKLRRNNFVPTHDNYEQRMTDGRVRKYSHQEKSSLESLLDDQSMNSPSDCERYYEGPRGVIPLSPTHYEQPPTPDHPPPSARQAENCIHERIRPLSQEYKRRSVLRDSQTETEVNLLRAASAASVASGATDRSGNTDNCVEEYVCDVPFAGLFKGSTTTLDGIGLRPMPAERPKTLRKLKSVYDASPTDAPPPPSNLSSNGQSDRNINGMEDEVRRRSNTTSSTQSGEKSLSILSPFDEQEEWAKISEIMASFGSKLVRESVFVSELEQEFTSRLGLSCSESSLSPSVASSLGLWLSGLGLHDYESLFLESGFDDIDFINGILDENDLREMGIEENERQKILESAKQLPLKITEIRNNNNNITKSQNESVEEWLKNINLEQYSDTFRKHLYVDMDRVRRIWEVELTAVLEIQKAGHRKRILASVSGEHNGPANHMEDINADLNTLKSNIQQLKEEIKEKLPPSENLKPVPPPVVPSLAPPGGETLKRSKKNRPAPQPPRPSDLEIRAPSELLVGVPGALKTQWKHQPFVLVTGAVTYVANYLGSTVVKELRGTESTKKSIQKLKKSTKEPRTSPDIILSISYRGVKFLNTITRELVCEHEIRNIHCACQDADDLTHFAYITKDHASKSHYCHVFRVATMDQATEVILTLGEAFEVAYQMALRDQSNRTRVTQSLAKTPTHDPMTTTNKEKPNVNHGRSHSITEIKLNGHQLKIAPLPASLSNEDFQAGARTSDGSRSPRTPFLKAPIASTEEL